MWTCSKMHRESYEKLETVGISLGLGLSGDEWRGSFTFHFTSPWFKFLETNISCS